MKRSKAF